MKSKALTNLLLFSVFGIALGFFGILYEGVVFGPKLLENSRERMLFWQSFYGVITPIVYYTPLNQLSTLVLVVLYSKTPRSSVFLKNHLKWASLFQVASFAVTLYIITQINLKLHFSDLQKYAPALPAKTLLFNVLSLFRVILTALALRSVFKAYVHTQQAQTQPS